MARFRAIGLGLAMLGLASASPASAQLSCSIQNLATLLAQFSDNAGNGSITPANVRNLVCSVQLLLAPGAPAVALAPGTSPFQYTAQVAGNLIVTSGAVAVSRNNGGTFYTTSLTGGSFALAPGDIVQVTW